VGLEGIDLRESANQSYIPTRADELTSEWLTSSLRETGVLREARVVEVKQEILGDGEGFMGEVIRLHLEFDQPEHGAPATLIAKLPTPNQENRTIGELMGAYEREILFYGDMASQLPVRTPRTYYSAMDASKSSEQEAVGAAQLDRCPMWLIRLVMRLVIWIASRRRRRYALLIEDLAPGRVGNQVAGCSPEEARGVLSAIAKVHAQHWGSSELEKSHWLRELVLNPRTMHTIFLKNLPGISERFRERTPESFASSLRWLENRGVELLLNFRTTAPETLLHCDLRLDNICFMPPETRPSESVVFLDWQLTGRGPGAYDVAYFLTSALATDVSDEVVRDLIRGYHDELVALGVGDYSFDRCLLDYQRALLAVLHRVSSTDTMDLGDGRGSELIATWLDRTLTRLSGVDYDALLDDRPDAPPAARLAG
jgi:hypothetical protein